MAAVREIGFVLARHRPSFGPPAADKLVDSLRDLRFASTFGSWAGWRLGLFRIFGGWACEIGFVLRNGGRPETWGTRNWVRFAQWGVESRRDAGGTGIGFVLHN